MLRKDGKLLSEVVSGSIRLPGYPVYVFLLSEQKKVVNEISKLYLVMKFTKRFVE